MKSKLLCSFFLVLFAFGPAVFVQAATPESVCVTKETIQMRENAEALFTKDTAAYKETADAQAAIKTYREHLDVAWEALNQPYCGYGQSSITSVKKSYTKTVSRARTAFQEAVKAKFAGKSLSTPPSDMAGKPSIINMPAEKQAPAKATPVITDESVPLGLQRGMRAEGVRRAQRRLAKHFNITDESSLVTGYFGPKTEELIIKFQLEKGIITDRTDAGAGLIGPRTAKALNALSL